MEYATSDFMQIFYFQFSRIRKIQNTKTAKENEEGKNSWNLTNIENWTIYTFGNDNAW